MYCACIHNIISKARSNIMINCISKYIVKKKFCVILLDDVLPKLLKFGDHGNGQND